MPEYDVLPVGTTVRVKSRLAPESICQVIDIRVDKRIGEVLYALGYLIPRKGMFRHWPKKQRLEHWASRRVLEVIEYPTIYQAPDAR